MAPVQPIDGLVTRYIPLQLLGERPEGVRDDTEALRHGLAPALKRVGKVRWSGPPPGHGGLRLLFACEPQKFTRVRPQAILALGGEREQQGLVRDHGRFRTPVHVLGHYQMGVGTTGAERRDSGDPGVGTPVQHGPFPVPQLLVDDERRTGEVDVRVQRRGVQ